MPPLPDGLSLAEASDGSFTIGLPKGRVPLTGEADVTKDLWAKLQTEQPLTAQRLSIVAHNPMIQFMAVDTALLGGKAEFVDNVNVNTQPTTLNEWTPAAIKPVTQKFIELFHDKGITSGIVTVDGHNVFRYRSKVEAGEPDYEVVGYQYVHNKRLVTVSVSCATGKMGGREKLFDQIASSVRFKD